MKLRLQLCFLCVLLFQWFLGRGQTTTSVGIPFITNFSPENYEADPQNWCIAQDKQGVIYAANSLGVLKFDGVEWVRIELPSIICRSVAVDDKNHVYVGSQGDIGMLEADSAGHLQYVSLLPKISLQERNFSDVWNVFHNEQGTFFFSPTKIFHLKNDKISVVKAPKKFNYCFDIANTIYTQDDSLGLCELTEQGFSVAQHGNFFINKEIRAIMPYEESGKLLVVTLKDGLFLYQPQTGETSKFSTTTQPYLTENLVFCGRKIENDLYAIGTFRGGIVFIDALGNLIQTINEEKGLRNNSVRQSFVDTHQGLWLALNNGIARIELHLPLSIFDKRNGLKGGVNRIINFQDKLVVGTSLGIFQAVKSQATAIDAFEQLPNFLDQCLNLLQLDSSHLFIASNRGTFVYSTDGKIIPCSSNASFVHAQIQLKNKNYVVAGLRNGIEIFEKIDNTWRFVGTLAGVSGEIRSLGQDKNGTLWAGTKVNGIYKIDFPTDITKPEVTQYSQKHGLPSNKQNKVFFTTSGIIIGTINGFYRFDAKKQQFMLDTTLKIPVTLSKYKESWSLYEDHVGNIWVFSGRYKAVFLKQANDTFSWNHITLSRIPFETISTIFEYHGTIWIGSANALYAYNKDFETPINQDFHVVFRRILLLNTDSIIAGSHYIGEIPEFSFQNNSISFEFAAAYFDDPTATEYQYQLEGYDKNWSGWTTTPQKDYTNLWNGSYKLKVRAKNVYGIVSNEAQYEFTITPPWYRTTLLYVVYIGTLLGLLFLLIRYYTSRLERKNHKLEELVTLRTAEIQLQKEEIESQRDNLVHLNNELATQKHEVEESYHKMQLLNDIGVEITSMLHIEEIVMAIYDNVNQLMDASVLAAGIYNEQRNRLEFYDIDDHSKKMTYSADNIDDDTKLSVWCYVNQREIFINDIQTEAFQYIRSLPTSAQQIPNSLIYIPLLVKGKKSGVITVQSYKLNAYNNYQRTIFANLATYISIALENATSYNIISIKNKQIVDSIRYAETIQKSILPQPQELQETFKDKYFIFYSPKDVVSGDFYWLSIKDETTLFVAVIDCTGHGVPGAFMSLIGATLLNEIVERKRIESPAKIIDALHEAVRVVLRQKKMANHDGMDVCLCKLEKKEKTTQVTYAGAKRPLYYVNRQGILEHIRGAHKSVGGGSREHADFEEVIQEVQPDEMLYLTTDGYTDQNNSTGEKFGSRRLKTILSEISYLDMKQQYLHIEEVFHHHKQRELQRDDVTIMGIRM